ncbi:hypothetical protein V7114_23645 [Neobacillus niacini]|uniref:hypothetical protein n=1 Tax=Neobacillus niacini TaxID=86668 RepID=UPI0030003BC4
MPLIEGSILYRTMMFRSSYLIKDEVQELKSQFTFRNVGQGLFYTGKIGEFLLVYDCGSLSDNSLRYITHSIEEFHNEVKTDKLGLLVISHFDNDHINGIPELSKRFSKIDTLIMILVFG